MPKKQQHTVECSICTETVQQKQSPRVIDGSEVCHSCVLDHIVPLFEAAMASELEYPAKWGLLTVPIQDFTDAIRDKSFIRRYLQRETEYKIAVPDRVCCSHSILVAGVPKQGSKAAKKLALSRAEAHEAVTVQCGATMDKKAIALNTSPTCFRCLGLLCRRCYSPLESAEEPHECHVEQKTAADLAQDGGLVQGKDLQLCPNEQCKSPIALRDGCNHILCPIAACRTSFCFLCGLPAAEDSDHWRTKCPRYNRAGDSNAVFDEADAHHDVNNIDDVNEADELRSPRPVRVLDGLRITEQSEQDLNTITEQCEVELRENIQLTPDLHPNGGELLTRLADLLKRNMRLMHATQDDGTHTTASWLELLEELLDRSSEIAEILPRLLPNVWREHPPTLASALDLYPEAHQLMERELVTKITGHEIIEPQASFLRKRGGQESAEGEAEFMERFTHDMLQQVLANVHEITIRAPSNSTSIIQLTHLLAASLRVIYATYDDGARDIEYFRHALDGLDRRNNDIMRLEGDLHFDTDWDEVDDRMPQLLTGLQQYAFAIHVICRELAARVDAVAT